MGGVLFFPASVNGSDRALWRTDGTPEGTVEVKEICARFCPTEMGFLTAFNGRLFFTADDNLAGSEPWSSDGTEAGTFRLKDIFPGSNGSIPKAYTEWNGALYFLATTGKTGYELWRTNGTPAGTVPVSTFPASPPPYFHVTALAAMGGRLYFAASDAAGSELWVMDGTPEGTRRVKDLNPGAASSHPHSLTAVGGRLYFVADGGTGNWSLWVTDGTEAGTVLLRTAASGWASEDEPRFLTKLGARLFFTMDDGLHGEEPWVTDGTPEGTLRLKDVALPRSSSEPAELTGAGGRLFLRADDGVSGSELWTSDGTAAGTRLVLDIQPGSLAAFPHSMRELGGALTFFTGSWNHQELWRSDGTPAGTRLFRDFSPGSASGVSRQPFLVLEPQGILLLAASDGISGMELWATDGADLWPVTDLAPGEGNSNPESLTRVGDFVYFTADDGTGREPWRIPVKAIEDVTPPVLTCPSGKKVEATAQDGAIVHYALAPPSDDRTSAVAVKYSQASGTKFKLGQHTVTVTATDTAGNRSSCSFQVSVVDTTRPQLLCLSGVTRQEATSPAGTPVRYPSATATDPVSPPVTLSYNPASGDRFPLGFTLVSVTATDAAGNQSQCGIQVRVEDTTAPSLTCPADAFAEAIVPSGTYTDLPRATATDNASASPAVTYDPAPWSLFPLGTTTVAVTATDDGKHQAACSFTMTVRDTTAPKLTCPADVTTEATSPTGAAVSWEDAEALDAVTPAPPVTYSHPPGSTFPLGTTAVTVQARDAAGNTASCGFQVTVPPMPEPTDAGTDGGTQTPDDGGTQAPEDGGVREPHIEPDTSGCGCSAGNSSASTGWGALLLLGWVMSRRRGMLR